MNLSYLYMDSPVGQLRLVANETALVAVLWDCEQPNRVKMATLVEDPQHPVLIETRRQLQEYFAGQRNTFELPLAFAGTEFQKRSGRLYSVFLMARPAAIATLLNRSAYQGSTRRRCSQWQKPDFDYCTLSSGDWSQWQAGRICRWFG